VREREGQAPSILDMGTAFAEPAPFSRDALRAIDCWHWCDGWHPERLPVYFALNPHVTDVELVVEGLLVLMKDN
jgi:hypothetical protein